jgi:hypothetical protein
MRPSRLFVALGVLVAAIALTTGAGAATRPAAAPAKATHVQKLDLSSMVKIKSYLRSIGVDPRAVVIQRGKKNYAGPHCPGKGWTCTSQTQRRLLQVGSTNTADCTTMRTSANPGVQECSVMQNGVRNFVRFEQVIDQSTAMDAVQTGTQTVRVTQIAGPGPGGPPKNELHVYQRIKQTNSSTPSQTQDAYQFVVPFAESDFNVQTASGGGDNFYDVHQYIDDKASGAATTQSQNTNPPPPEILPAQCAGRTPSRPNQCLFGNQQTDSGNNESHLQQLIDEDAKTKASGATQTQGNEFGGSGGDIHQSVGGGDFSLTAPVSSTGTGSSQNHADQARRQNVAGGEFQTQIDPGRCCGVSQTGGQKNREDINQDASQKSDENTSDQHLTLIGECDTQNGDCLITHHARNDEAHTSVSCGGPGKPDCGAGITTTCGSTEFFDGEGPGECTTTPTEVPDLSLGDGIMSGTAALPEVPLSGFEITMGLIPAP